MATSNEAEKARHALRRRRRLRQVLERGGVCPGRHWAGKRHFRRRAPDSQPVRRHRGKKRGIRTAAANACLAGPGAF